MSKLTLDEAIKHCFEVAEENDLAAGTYEILAENNHNAYERLTAGAKSSRCAECAANHRQLAEWLTELKEAKRLLKAAVEEFSNMYDHIFDCDGMCETCPLHGERDNCLIWRYAKEALALIEKDGDTDG